MAKIITMQQSYEDTRISVRLRDIVHILKDATNKSVPLFGSTREALIEIAIARAETLADEFDGKTTKVTEDRPRRKYVRKPKEQQAEAEPPKRRGGRPRKVKGPVKCRDCKFCDVKARKCLKSDCPTNPDAERECAAFGPI